MARTAEASRKVSMNSVDFGGVTWRVMLMLHRAKHPIVLECTGLQADGDLVYVLKGTHRIGEFRGDCVIGWWLEQKVV